MDWTGETSILIFQVILWAYSVGKVIKFSETSYSNYELFTVEVFS